MSIGAYDREIALSKERQEESLHDPNGVSYIGQLWEMIEDKSEPLAVVLRTDEETFTDISVPAYWHHGRYHWQDEDDREKSELIFQVPKEVTRRVQSRKAQEVLQRFFSQTQLVELDNAFLPEPRDLITPYKSELSGGVAEEEIVDNWDALKNAIHMTAEDSGGYLGGQPIEIWGPRRANIASARIQDDRLELHLGEYVVQDMYTEWAKAFRREVLLEEPRR